MNYIHLKHYHTNTRRFKHLLLEGVTTVSEEDLNALAEEVIDGGVPDRLILALRGCVSMLVGRYLGNFSDLENLIDDMVSEGLLAISELCGKLPEELIREKGVLKVATSRAQYKIERMLNSMRALSSPCPFTQLAKIRNDEDPVYLTTETNEYAEVVHPEDGGDEAKRDILDAVCKLQPQDELDIYLLNEFNWGKTYQELADELRVGVGTIHRRKARLYQQYLDLTR